MILTRIIAAMLAPKACAFEMATKDPIAAQKKVLLEYMRRNEDTEYGKKYDFANIRSIEDYQRRVPLSDCESMRPYIDRMKKGEQGILTADSPIFFGLTSGTTNKPKYIPTTKYSSRKKAELMDAWTYYIVRDHPDILKGKVLALISPDNEGVTEAGIPYGFESGLAYKNLNFFAKSRYAIPAEVFKIHDYAARYYAILRIGMEENISTVATLNPSSIILLSQKIAEWQGRIIDDIEKGTLSRDFNMAEEVRKSLEGRFRPNPRRAAELRAILKTKKVLLPKDFWPNLVLIECWKAGTVRIYLKELAQYFGDVPVRDFGCLATEARSSIAVSDEGSGSVLAANANFYEFVPKDEMDSASRRFLLCNELKEGMEYYIIVTTPGGLYRYNIDDIIRVDGFFNKTPIIEFAQKGLNAVSLTGEKVYESQINAALMRAVEKSGALVRFFSATIEFATPGYYVFLTEFDADVAPDRKRAFLVSMEEGLRLENREYDDLRNEGVLDRPVLRIVKRGSFEKYRQMKIAQGAPDGQFKAPQLTADPSFQKNFNIEEEIRGS